MAITKQAHSSPVLTSDAPIVPDTTIFSSWDEWSPRDYLADYYRVVEPDEIATIRFLVETAKRFPRPGPILVFGTGPTLHHVFPLAPAASELHLTDYLPRNLDQIRAWVGRRQPCHDWRPFVRYTLQCEGVDEPTETVLGRREALVRDRITTLVTADAGHPDPLGPEHRASYPVVVSCYCADSATADKRVWRDYMTNIVSLLRPGGLFVTAALRRALRYKVGSRYFPSANIDEHDLREFLDHALGEDVMVDVRIVSEHEALGYTGIVLGSAVKRR
ncbi:MAG: NNMT/PNMT/TEMT family class I SAM-dependent methyltransferase [Chloroflexota bacterium]|nr:NNMT/PNMT/TEMT family class I SAM-dependent methyltransferase [Chloroflexota bacterium]